MKLSLKELRENYVWLLIIQRRPLIEPPTKLAAIIDECNELISIFVASTKTAEQNSRKQGAKP